MIVSLAGIVVLLLLAFAGLPLAFALLVVGAVGFGYLRGWESAYELVGQSILDTATNYGFSVIPMFVMMGAVLHRSGIADELFETANAWFGHMRGGLAMGTIAACGGFSAVCGSSVATAATMGRVAYRPMLRFGYNSGLAAGTIAAGGTLGILIPPSVVMVIYGLLTNQDIGKLFIAGIVPGIITVLLYLLVIAIVCWIRPAFGPRAPRTSWLARLASLRGTWSFVALFVVVLGGIYLGLVTPTEASGIGAAGALAIAMGRRRLTLEQLRASVLETGKTTAMLFAVVFGGVVFAGFVNMAGLPGELVRTVKSLDLDPLIVALAVVLIYLVLGCVMDSITMILLTVPVFYPLIESVGLNLIWFGVMVVVAAEVGMITPPIGMNVFVLRSVLPDIELRRIFIGLAPFYVADLVRIGLFLAFPSIVLLLPSMMR